MFRGWKLWDEEENYYCLIVAIFSCLIGLILLIVTAFMDPGIIPRTQQFEDIDANNELMCPTAIQPVLSQTGEMKRSPQPPFKQYINIGGRVAIIKYCCMLSSLFSSVVVWFDFGVVFFLCFIPLIGMMLLYVCKMQRCFEEMW